MGRLDGDDRLVAYALLPLDVSRPSASYFGAAYTEVDTNGQQRVLFSSNSGWGLYELDLDFAVPEACWNSGLDVSLHEACDDGPIHDDGATLDHLREAVTTLTKTELTARRVLGGEHPSAVTVGRSLQNARAALHARETQDAFQTARTKLAQERSELAQTLADASAKPSQDT